MNDAHQPKLEAPQLRTLLLTDLCDSTALVEKIGDNAAAELFREHDHLVLTLQRAWRGRLIDRSDGLLLLFERPIDGLGFALDYTRGLQDLGEARKLKLHARAGLHVGEVLTWRNSEEAVSVGAKPLEVEGLAKPMAARLMTLARPGQILLSAVAESLTHRAARELGERGQRLLWKSHGRWRFKGVPTAQEIYEVGEVGLTPLRAPKGSAKAWRDLPLWRRPAALVAEAGVLVTLCVVAWFASRPQPAIAFAERDWVVMGDLSNQTGDDRLNGTLQQAFRISLEQSPYVNILSDLKVRDTLGRMRKDADNTLVDRVVGSDVALRNGARLLILPSVSEVGGHLKASIELVDPATQRTVYVKSVDGQGIRSLLPMVDEVVVDVRSRLGEQLASIGGASAPLPDVTTSNIDALRAFALGQKKYAASDFEAALSLYVRARSLDEKFALAWLGELRTQQAIGDTAGAIESLRHAKRLQGRLPPREAMYLDAWTKEYESPQDAADAWKQLADLYPDYEPALANASNWLYVQNRFAEALAYSRRASRTQYVFWPINLDMAGRSELAQGNYQAADRIFEQSLLAGRKSSLRGRMAAAAASGNFERANALMLKVPTDDQHAHLYATSVLLDQGRVSDAVVKAQRGWKQVAADDGFDGHMYLLVLGVATWQSGSNGEAERYVRKAYDASLKHLRDGDTVAAVDNAALALASSLVLLRIDKDFNASEVLSVLDGRPDLMKITVIRQFSSVVAAEKMRLEGKPTDAIELLSPFLDGTERFQTRVALMKAMEDSGQYANAVEQARWLKGHRGLAYAELECGYCLQPLNVVDSRAAESVEQELLRKLATTANADDNHQLASTGTL